MSKQLEQEKQAAIAKMQAQGCRRWMSLLVLVPVLLCAILTLIAPSLQTYLARQESNQRCQELVSRVEPVSNSTIFETELVTGEAIITAGTIESMVLFDGEREADFDILSRDNSSAVSHPRGDYAIYPDYRPSEGTNVFICGADRSAKGSFTADESAGEIVFNRDGSIFAVADKRFGRVMLFDGVDIRPLETISIRGTAEYRQIDSIAFHPTEPLLFFISEDEMFVYELETYREIFRVPVFETLRQEIGFNAEGSLFFMGDIRGESLYIWGVRE